MICRLCKRVGIAKGLCMPHYLEAYRRKNPRRHSTRGDFQTGRAKPRSAHADRPGSDEAGCNVGSGKVRLGKILAHEFTGARKDVEK